MLEKTLTKMTMACQNVTMSREILGADVIPGTGGNVRVMIGWFLRTMKTLSLAMMKYVATLFMIVTRLKLSYLRGSRQPTVPALHPQARGGKNDLVKMRFRTSPWCLLRSVSMKGITWPSTSMTSWRCSGGEKKQG